MAEFTLVGATQDELVARLAQRPRFQRPGEPTPCVVGWPDGGPKEPEHVWVDGMVDDWTVEWATTGQYGVAPQEETFGLAVNFLVTRDVPTFSAIRDQCLELAGELATLLRVDSQLGGLVREARIAAGEVSEGFAVDGPRQCLVEIKVAVVTYLAATTASDG